MEESIHSDISNINKNKSELWNLSFRDLFFKYIRFLPLFILSIALCLLAAYLYLRYTVPIYSVGGTMLVKSEQAGGRGDKFEEMFVNNRTQNIQSEMEIIRSRPLMQRVVDSLDLRFSYLAKGKIKTVNIYKQSPFVVRALKIADSSASFTFKIKFLNETEFRIIDKEGTFRFGQEVVTPYGSFVFLKTAIPPASNEYI
ncbi:MAG TPA: hypothetical protein PKI55_12645, partial [Chitinophagaceae bacterium]|nr:hypothetical protein [Chitinophagaceae bacterium]